TGGWLSTTITRWVQTLKLPEMSVTVQTTELVPTGKLAGASLVTPATVQLSNVSGMSKLTPVAEHWPWSALAMTVPGHEIVGGWLSTTITLWVQTLELPFTSVAVHTTKFVPTE